MKSFIPKALILICVCICFALNGCYNAKRNGIMIGQAQGSSAGEKEIYAMLNNIKFYISAGMWDKWLAMYSDDAVLTYAGENINKDEMRKRVEGLVYFISKIEVLKQNVGEENAEVSVKMTGNGKPHLETYHFQKLDGRWLIVREANP